jgi:hypothetical protein
MSSVSIHNTARLPAILPLSFLMLTCCMGQVQADTQITREPVTAMGTAGQIDTVPITMAASSATATTAPDAAALLNQKSAKFGGAVVAKADKKAKKPARKGMAEEAVAEEEEDEEVDEEDAEVNAPTGRGGLGGKTIQADFDQNVRATLKEVVVRGSVLSVTVALNYKGTGKNKRGKEESEGFSVSNGPSYTHVLDYESGTQYPVKKHDGFTSGRLSAGQTDKTVRVTFEAPPRNVKAVGITIYGIGTFDDVTLRALGSSISAKPSVKPSGKGSAPAATDEEDGEDEEADEDEEEDDETDASSLRQIKKRK